MNPFDYIKLEAIGLAVGQTLRVPCPFCGSVHAHKFNITRTTDGLLYNCHRAVCGKHGFIGSLTTSTKKIVTDSAPKFYTKETSMLPTEILNWLITKYQLSESTITREGWTYNMYENRLVMPMRDINGVQLGTVAKQLPAEFGFVSGPKSVTYKHHSDSVKLHFPLTTSKGEECVVVEDFISATKVGQIGFDSVAIVGTHLGKRELQYLAMYFKRLILALDPDAISKAINIKMDNALYFPHGIEIVSLQADPKDTEETELLNKLNEVIYGN